MEVVTSLIGLLGVLVGAAVSAWLPDRARRRQKAREAARLAGVGLHRWLDGIEYMRKAPSRLSSKGEDYDIFLAIELSSLRKHLDNDWWTKHGVQLSEVADQQEWRALEDAGRATGGLLMMLDDIGDAGEQALMKRARSRGLRQRTDAGRRSLTIGASPGSSGQDRQEQLSSPLPGDLDDDDRQGADRDEAQRTIDEFGKDMDQFQVDLDADLAEIRVWLDHRLWLVRDLADTLTRAEEKVIPAAAACAAIAEASGGR